jgi:putative CocE/NonD family hydrolase
MRIIAFVILLLPLHGLFAQNFTSADYEKEEIYITMRDGVKLFTSIYSPKDKSQDYPVIIQRSPYSCAPYGKDKMPDAIHYNKELVASGYIFIIQDMRGRWMSEGEFENTKPPYHYWNKKATDEVTDSYDTFDWIKKKLDNFNGNIGQIGNSYLGHTSIVSSVTGHPNLKCVLAMAPVTNFYFEDFNRYGLYGLNYAPVMDVFGIQKKDTTSKSWYNVVNKDFMKSLVNETTEDYYSYFLKKKSLKNMDYIIDPNNFFWKNIKAHPNYDEYRQKRNWLQYLDKAKCQTLIVGGWHDEQNLYGIVNSFIHMDSVAEKANVKLCLGPWSHGHPQRRDHEYRLGDVFYGYDLAENYQKNVEFSYFEYHLKGKGKELDFKARVYDTGKKEWGNFDSNPFTGGENYYFYPGTNNQLLNAESSKELIFSYISDPNKPVPYTTDDQFYIMAPKRWMVDDQRPASKRPDVLTFSTGVLDKDVTVKGKIEAILKFATDHEDADLYVKIIDVYPMDRTPEKEDLEGVKMNGYQQLVRAGYIRGRYRNSFENPEKFTKKEKTEVNVPLLEVFHTFKKGHKIMIQIQSSMFPLFDLNPQKWVDNIYEADPAEFKRAWHLIYSDSKFVFPVVRSSK